MNRPMFLGALAIAFTLGAAWWHTTGAAEAAGKKTAPAPAAATGSCTDELARANKELAAAREDARKARAERDQLLKAEADRVKRLEVQLGTKPVDTLK
jgi:hypothetical protein